MVYLSSSHVVLVPVIRAPTRILFPLCWQVHSIQSPGCHSDSWPVTSRNGRLWWGGPPGPHGSPWTRSPLKRSALAAPAEAGRGAGSGRGRPPYHLSRRLYNPAPPVARLTPDFLDSHIPQGYQGHSPWRQEVFLVLPCRKPLHSSANTMELAGFCARYLTATARRADRSWGTWSRSVEMSCDAVYSTPRTE